jgi:NADH-quinone oxidoreductase subunit H
MSVIETRPVHTSAFKAGQFFAGLVVLFVVVAALSALALVPWGFAQPALDLIGRYPLINALAKGTIVSLVLSVVVLFLIWLERKIAGWMQARLGPMHVGWKGLGQTAADAVKLLIKEDVIPAVADKPLFIIAPFLVMVPTMLTYMVLPFSMVMIGYDLPLAALYVIAVSTITALGIMSAGWGANNKYSLLGGVRAVAQLLSYEIPMVIVILTVVTLTQTMSTVEMVRQQAGLFQWNIFRFAPVLIPGFLIYLTCAMAELNRAPFDLPEAESELVSGFHTEYSGMRFAFFFLAEFANNFFSAGFAVVLFFGGWLGPILPAAVWFTLKTVAIVLLMMWIRWTLPRLRIDQMMGFCWKALVPLSFVVFCAAVVWGLYTP